MTDASFSWLYRRTAPNRSCPDCGYLVWAGQGSGGARRCRGCIDDDERDSYGTWPQILRLLRGAA
jgi:hypothetical protein